MPFTYDFKKFRERTEEHNLGRPVPTRYRKEFGLIYNQKEMLNLAKKFAKSKGIRIYK